MALSRSSFAEMYLMPRKVKPDMYKAEDFSIEWSLSVGKGDGDATGEVSYKGKRLGVVKITISKFRIDRLGYNKNDILAYATRVVLGGINSGKPGKYKELRDAIEA